MHHLKAEIGLVNVDFSFIPADHSHCLAKGLVHERCSVAWEAAAAEMLMQ